MYGCSEHFHSLFLKCHLSLDVCAPDAGRSQQACPFCHRMYQRGASLRDHIKYCQEREGGHMVCPLCGYTATLRAQMERHLALHNQVQDKVRYTQKARETQHS